MSRQGHELVDNQYELNTLPNTKVPRYDAGLQEVHYDEYLPRQPGYYGYQQTSSNVEFIVDGQGLENLRDAKLFGKVKLGGASVTKATLDGGIAAVVGEFELKTKDNTPIEQLKRVNRVMQSLKLNTSHAANLKGKFESWDDGLYKGEHITAPTSGDVYKRHLTTSEQEFCIPLNDLSLYLRHEPLWNSEKHGAIRLSLSFDKDGNVLSACDITTSGVAQVIITELKLVVPCYKITDDFAKKLRGVKNEIQTFESYRVFPEAAASAQQTITVQAGLNNLTGIALLPRLSTEENVVGLLGTTAAAVRYLTGCPNSAITSLQFTIGDIQFPKRPIRNQKELYSFNKDYFKIQHDTDCGSLIEKWNWDVANQDSKDITLEATDSRHMYFNFARNGLATGVDANVREIRIEIEQTAVSNLVYDVVAFYSKVFQLQGSIDGDTVEYRSML